MKKGLVFVMIATVLGASLMGCGGKTEGKNEKETTEEAATYQQDPYQAVVNNPFKEAPSYVLPEGASTDEMREMAIKAMRDELSVKWTPVQNFTYRKSGSVSDKDYIFSAQTVYAGLPYTTSASGLFQWLEYYDYANGNLHDAPFNNMEGHLGNSCSASCSWGLAAVCPSLGNADSTFRFTRKSNMFPLGDVTYSESIINFKDYSTKKICDDNGKDKVLESYTLLKKADIVLAAGDDTDVHGMMVVEEPKVERNADGTIDSQKSTVVVQDQRANDYLVDEDGQKVSYRGRLSAEVTFESLWSGSYLALSTEEFMNNATYVKATVAADKEATDLNSLSGVTIDSNYRIAVVRLNITDESGKKVYTNFATTGNKNIQDDSVHYYSLRSLCNASSVKRLLESGKKYTVKVSVTVATGETFEPVKFELTAE